MSSMFQNIKNYISLDDAIKLTKSLITQTAMIYVALHLRYLISLIDHHHCPVE